MTEIITSDFESKFIDFDSSIFEINSADDSSTKKDENAIDEKAAEKNIAANDDDVELRNLKNEVNQLQKKKKIKTLKTKIAKFRFDVENATIIAESSSALFAKNVNASQTTTVMKTKILKFDSLSSYHERFDDEYRKFFANVNLTFLKSFDYFFHDINKILHCMTALRNDFQIQ